MLRDLAKLLEGIIGESRTVDIMGCNLAQFDFMSQADSFCPEDHKNGNVVV